MSDTDSPSFVQTERPVSESLPSVSIPHHAPVDIPRHDICSSAWEVDDYDRQFVSSSSLGNASTLSASRSLSGPKDGAFNQALSSSSNQSCSSDQIPASTTLNDSTRFAQKSRPSMDSATDVEPPLKPSHPQVVSTRTASNPIIDTLPHPTQPHLPDQHNQWYNIVQWTLPTGGRIRWKDALVVVPTEDSKYIISSPNCPVIPEPVFGYAKVTRCADGRFGQADPVQWPQVFWPGNAWLALAQKRPADLGDPRRIMWRTPTTSDIIPSQGSYVSTLGNLNSELIAEMKPLVDYLIKRAKSYEKEHGTYGTLRSLCNHVISAFDRLDIPATKTDIIIQIACVQRHWILATAWLDFYKGGYAEITTAELDRPVPAVKPQFMGCFTTDPEVVQRFFRLGVPVYYMRLVDQFTSDIVVLKSGAFVKPDDIITTSGDFSSSPLCVVKAGLEHLKALATMPNKYIDIEVTPLPENFGLPSSESHEGLRSMPAPWLSTTTKSSSSLVNRTDNQKPSTRFVPYPSEAPSHKFAKGLNVKNKQKPKRGQAFTPRDKFQDPDHPWCPSPITSWSTALRDLGNEPKEFSGASVLGYYVPDPGLFLGAQTTERAWLYIRNWVRTRDAWWYMLEHASTRRGVPPIAAQWWRDFLRTEPTTTFNAETHTGRRQSEVWQLFGRVFAVDKLRSGTVPAIWRRRVLASDTPSELVAQEVLWELFEVGFRFELYLLDRKMMPAKEDELRLEQLADIFPDHRAFRPHPFPAVPKGLAAIHLRDRAGSLEALRYLVIAWPTVPVNLKYVQPLTKDTPEELLLDTERQLSAYYVRSFWVEFGRPALIPHRLPPCV